MKKSIMLVFTFLMLALSAFSADLSKLQKISNPTKEQAREFFNWTIETNRIARVNGLPIEQDGILYYPGTMLPGWTEFQSSQGQSLHVGNDSYTPTQPLVAYDKFTSAVERMGLSYAVSGVGEFDNYKNIFAQLDVQNSPGNHPEENVAWMQKAGSSFTVGGKEYKGLLTMAKGNDESLSLIVYLTIICIVCQNTFRASLRQAKKGNKANSGITHKVKQTKNSGERVATLEEDIMALFGIQESVMATLQRMAETPVSINDAERAFLGLLKQDEKPDMSKTGKTRLANSLERYLQAFNNPTENGTTGETRADWLNAVTFVDTHGNVESTNYDADKQFISSEFNGTYAKRKETAYAMASEAETWDKLVHTGESLMSELLTRTVVPVATTLTSDFSRLLDK